MAEWSGLWSTTSGTLGDAQSSYSQTDSSTINRIMAACWGYQGVAPGYLNELAVTVTGANTVAVNTGGAIVDGKVYNNSASVNVNIPSAVGGGNTRIDRIVVRATWASTDAAITRIAGTDAASPTAPAITETSGTTYDVLLAQVLVNTAGACTVTAETDRAQPVEVALAVMSVPGNSAYAQWRGVSAGSDHTLYGRHGTSLGFIQVPAGGYEALSIASADIGALAVTVGKINTGAVTAGAYGADSITITDIGALVPGFLGRQGGSATDWSSAGTNNYTSGINVRIQCGVATTDGSGAITVTFPVAFANAPIILVTVASGASARMGLVTYGSASATQVQLRCYLYDGSAGTSVLLNWCAIGPEA